MAAFISSRRVISSASDFIVKPLSKVRISSCLNHSTGASKEKSLEDGNVEEEFRVYEIEELKSKQTFRDRRRMEKRVPPPRFRSMPTDQDWTDVWPTASTFNWSVVPFPARQGFIESSIENEGVVPSKYANMELMKIPNFLHLTPSHIQKHCEALKQFCTAWPEALDTDEKCRQYFPVEHVTADYLSSSPSQQDSRARTAVIKFHLSDLDLDYHARDKFIRLVGDRYEPDSDEVVLESDRCPLKSQNLDFLNFVLTAVYFESWKTESWESMKQLSDMEQYFWDKNKSRQSLMSLLKEIKHLESSSPSKSHRLDFLPDDVTDEDAVCRVPQVEEYRQAVSDVFNHGDTDATLDTYKQAVTNVLNLKNNL